MNPPDFDAMCRRLRDKEILPRLAKCLRNDFGLPPGAIKGLIIEQPEEGVFGFRIEEIEPFRMAGILSRRPCGRANCSLRVHLGNRPRGWRQAVVAAQRWFKSFPARMLVSPEQQRGGALEFAVSQAVLPRDADLAGQLTRQTLSHAFGFARFAGLWMPDLLPWIPTITECRNSSPNASTSPRRWRANEATAPCLR